MILLIPPAVLLTISFFVLVTASKVDAKSLKIFGWVVCVLLWVTAALILATAITMVSPNHCGSYGMLNGQCPLRGTQDWRTDPHHAWMNNPHSRSMLEDPHAGLKMDPHHGMLMDSMDDTAMEPEEDITGSTMGGMMGKDKGMKCPAAMPMPAEKK
jgi:hypothetical protein